MLIVQRNEIIGDNDIKHWYDAKECKTRPDAKEYIEKRVHEYGDPAGMYRIIMILVHCQSKIEFIDDVPVSENTENKLKSESFKEAVKQLKAKEEEKSKPKTKKSRQTYSDEELKLLYFERSCELGHWAKTAEFDDVDRNKYPTWFTYQNRMGSKSNIIDMICFDLRKEKLPPGYREIIDQYFTSGKERHSGVYVIKKLTVGSKKK